METPRIALVTARSARQLDEDMPLLEAALHKLVAGVEVVEWDDAAIDWGTFDLIMLRSAWDYSKRHHDFLAWAQTVAHQARLLNPYPALRWNTDKHYLADLNHAHVPVVASHFVEIGEAATTGLQRFFALHPEATDFVVKPTVGAGSRDVKRFERAQVDAADSHAQRILDTQRSVLLQPYYPSVDQQGETALLYINGEFSHAVRKGALLRRGEEPMRALFKRELISPCEAQADEVRVATETLAAHEFGTLLYARVDLIRDPSGQPRVLELELVEPTFFLSLSPGSADRFAEAIVNAAGRKD